MWFIRSLVLGIGFDPLFYFLSAQMPIHIFSLYIIAEIFWFCNREGEFFTTSPTGSARHNAARFVLMLLLGVSQEVAKKETRPFLPGPPLPPAVLKKRTAERRSFASFLHLRGIYPTPQMGQHGKSCCYPVLFEISSNTGKEAVTNTFCQSGVRASSVSVAFFKPRSQKLKM
jgi:hypothetical protein